MITDPPPAQVIIMQTCTASASAGSFGSTQTWDTGLGSFLPGQSGAATFNPPTSLVNGGSITGTYYFVQAGGATVLLPAFSPAAHASKAPSSASVSYTATISPVIITLGGTLIDANGKQVLDGNGNQQILVGQKCQATINGIPSGTGWTTTYAWTVSGITFESWSPTTPPFPNATPPTVANLQASYYDSSPPPATNPTNWYWNDNLGSGKSKTETVTCTATITPPTGQGAAFSVTATQSVLVQVPGWTATGTGGYMQVNSEGKQDGSIYLYAGPAVGQYDGMNWVAALNTPPSPFSQGTLELVQIAKPNLSYITNTKPGVQHTDSENGQSELDTQYPYPWASSPSPYMTNDSPDMNLVNFNAGSAIMTSTFTDYLMYQPPGSSQWVPLGTFAWGTNGNATIPATKNWADYATQNGTDAVGKVTPTAATPFTPGNAFPSWTQISKVKTF